LTRLFREVVLGPNGTAEDFIKYLRSVYGRNPVWLDFFGFLSKFGDWDCGVTFPFVMPHDGATLSG